MDGNIIEIVVLTVVAMLALLGALVVVKNILDAAEDALRAKQRRAWEKDVYEAMGAAKRGELPMPNHAGELFVGVDFGSPYSSFCVVRKCADGRLEVLKEWTQVTPVTWLPDIELDPVMRVVCQHLKGKEPVVVKVSSLREAGAPCVLDELRAAFAGIAEKVNERIDEETKAARNAEKLRAMWKSTPETETEKEEAVEPPEKPQEDGEMDALIEEVQRAVAEFCAGMLRKLEPEEAGKPQRCIFVVNMEKMKEKFRAMQEATGWKPEPIGVEGVISQAKAGLRAMEAIEIARGIYEEGVLRYQTYSIEIILPPKGAK